MTVVDGDTMGVTIDAPFERLRANATERGTRALLLVEMRADIVPPAAGTTPRTPAADRADRLTAHLGTENRCLLHDARGALDPALLAAEIGTLVTGGLLVLLIAPPGTPATRSATRFARHLDRLEDTMGDTSERLALPRSARSRLRKACDAANGAQPPSLGPSPDTVAAQDDCLDRITAQLDDARATAALIAAPRGRGKSALAGRFAAHLERSGVAYAVTAAHRSATEVLERHRCLTLATLSAEAPAPLPFLAPDAALRTGGEALIVDEAASLPLPSIEALLDRYRHVVLASTSEGHESAGRAFALQIPALLERARPGAWLTVSPTGPLRWRDGDPLEAFVSRTLLSSSEIDHGVGTEFAPTGAFAPRAVAREVERDALLDDEPRLAALFGLLSATHYQSSPLDLVHLLDSPVLRLWTVEHADTVLGVALVAIERGLPAALHEDVLARRRRPPHCLLPQLLAQCADDATALDADFARVVRIAVHPDARRHGLGSRLVEALVRDTADTVEAVGASFGARPASLAFWRSNGFSRFHVGYRRNARSGERSAAVLRAGSARTSRVLAEAVDLHRDNCRAALSIGGERGGGEPPDGPPAADTSAASALAGYRRRGGSGRTGGGPDVDERRDVRLLRRFVEAERSVADTRGALSRLATRAADHDAARCEGPGAVRVAADVDGLREDDTTRLLAAFGERTPPSRRARERALREAVRARMATLGW